MRSKWWKIPLCIISIGFCLVLVCFIIKEFWHFLLGLQNGIAAALIAASATVVVSVVSITAGKYYEKKRSIEQELRAKKIPVYEDFVEFIFNILWSDKIRGKQMSEMEMQKFFVKFTQKLVVWGSDAVINKWGKYRISMINYSSLTDPEESQKVLSKVMFELEDLMMAIRTDIGYKNGSISQGGILRLFINDVEKYL